jgi:mRNA interferase RelE/StbE
VIVKFDNAFERDIKKLSDQAVKDALADAICKLEEAQSLKSVPEVSTMTGHKSYYLFKMPPYRIGILKVSEDTIILMRFMHRKDIYKKFP